MIESIRSSEDHVLLLDSGGVFADRGQRLKLKPDVILKAMDLMGYDALNIGSYEFSFGLDFFKRVSSGISFPFISSNLVYDKSRFPWLKDHIIKNVGGLRVAILGVMPVEAFENILDPESLKNLKIIPPETALKNLLPEVRKKADFVILLSQSGFKVTTSLVDKLNGVDLAISYGRKKCCLDKGGRTQVVLTGSRGQSLGFLQVTMSKTGSETGRIIQTQGKIIQLDESVAADEQIAKMVDDAFYEKAREKRIRANRKLRKIEQEINKQEINKLMKMPPDEYIETLHKKQAEGGDKR